MKGDFTRRTFRPNNHYSGVLLQQGRVQTDADFNEQVGIGAHRDRTTTGDVVGPCGAPIHNAGFELVTDSSGTWIGDIGSGRYYVDGILCESETPCTYVDQPDLRGATLPSAPGRYVAYLDVWQHHVTVLEAPDLREVALGGPDTATRSKTVWQVKVDPDPVAAGFNCASAWTPSDAPTVIGQLAAQAEPAPPDVNECLVPPGAGYRRLENQLYRVEIHDAGPVGTATFKWSRDNGSVVTRLEQIDDRVLTVSEAGKDAVLGFGADQWVELTDEDQALRGEPGTLVELESVQGNALTIKAWPGTPLTMASFGQAPVVRRWDSPGATKVSTGAMLDLEGGVQVQFTPGDYRTGDFWQIPARSLTGQVEWPRDSSGPLFEDRQGIVHHYCMLGILELSGSTWKLDSDCRRLFPPITELTSFFYLSGDNQEAMPDPTQPAALLALAQPLRAGVAIGEWPVEGATVRFEIVPPGTGRLKRTDEPASAFRSTPVEVSTTADGVAACNWEIDSVHQTQQVQATLRDAGGAAVHLPVRFTANLSVASQVAYDPGTCANLGGANTVQAAVDRLASLTSLAYLGGDAQETIPDPAHPADRVELAQPLQVVVANGCGPVSGAVVEFEIVKPGDGRLKPTGEPDSAYTDQPVKVTSDAQGIARCDWAVDAATTTQQARATLVEADGLPITDPLTVGFIAHVNLASGVYYDSSQCEGLKDATTVQAAIDQLCKMGADREPGMYVTDVRLNTQQPLRNDTPVPVTDFVKGVRVVCDREIDQGTVLGKPTCFITLDLPYPLSDSDMQLWDMGEMIGFRPLILDATPNAEKNAINWTPSSPTAEWLQSRLFQVLAERKRGDRVLAHLTLKGNFIWAADDPQRYLDGDIFGMRLPDHSNTDLDFRNGGSGDGRRGGDFEMWFWLVQTIRLAGLGLRDAASGKILVNPSVVGGTVLEGVVALSGLATEDTVVGLGVEPAGAVAFADKEGKAIDQVTVPQGEFEVRFQVRPNPVAKDLPATITAQLGNDVTRTALTVLAPQLATLTLPTGEVTSGGKLRGSVTLNGVAPANGAVVNLQSDTPNVATVPARVTVKGGANTASFDIATSPADAEVQITATLGTTQSGTLTLRGAWVTEIKLSTNSLVGGSAVVNGTVTLARPAPAEGQSVNITPHSDPPGIATIVNRDGAVVTAITVPKGASSETFQIMTSPVASQVTVPIEGALPGQSEPLTTSIAVLPVPLDALVLPTTVIQGGSTAKGSVRLGQRAPADTVVSLVAEGSTLRQTTPIGRMPGSSADKPLEGRVTVPKGSDTASFDIQTLSDITRRVPPGSPGEGTSIESTVKATITASYGGVSKETDLSIHVTVWLEAGTIIEGPIQ